MNHYMPIISTALMNNCGNVILSTNKQVQRVLEPADVSSLTCLYVSDTLYVCSHSVLPVL